MDQSTLIVFALVAVLLIAGASVVLLGRNAARSTTSEASDAQLSDGSSTKSNAKEIEANANSAQQVITLEKLDEDAVGISRRKFLNRSIYGVLGLGVLPAFGLSLLSFLIPSGKGGFGGLVSVTTGVDDIISQIKNTKKPFYIPEARAYIVQFPKENGAAVEAAEKVPDYTSNPKIIDGMVKEGLVALYQKCPHLGCRVPWCDSSQWFECPCHGSKYNRVGEKTGGPAPRGMDRFPFDVVGGKLVINTNLSSVVSGPPIGTDTTRQGAEGPLCV